MRNLSIPTFKPFDAPFTGVDGINYFAQIYYPNGESDRRYWMIHLCHVGGISEPIASAEAYLKRKAELTQWGLFNS